MFILLKYLRGLRLMIIEFIRHAEAKKDKLTGLGKKQAKLMAEQKDDFVFSKIYCSPMKRCKDTAKILKKKTKLKIEIDERLKERETLRHKPNSKEEQSWYDNYLNPKYSNFKPEGCKELLERVYEFLGERISVFYH